MESSEHKVDRGGIVVAALLLLAAAVIAWDATTLQLTATYGLGPKAMPFVVAAGLAVLAIGNLALALRGDFPEREPGDPVAILLILGGLAALIALIAFGGGFILATAVLFTTVSTAFGRRAIPVDFGIGLALGLGAYLMFAKLLTLSLPMGPIERLL
jgi:putative tricarboxylic transport membrane protein